MTRKEKNDILKDFCANSNCGDCKIAKECNKAQNFGKSFESYNEEEIEKCYSIISSENNVNHPNHYNQHSMECIDEMLLLFPLEWVKGFCACNAWKYRERAPYKGTQEEDDKKADWYLNKLKELKED